MRTTPKRQNGHSVIIFLFPLLIILLQTQCITCSPSKNAYETLGVSKSSTQDEIRLKYRKLCLQYHPDKNVHKSESEREKCEETFKQIQKANSDIGDAESRIKYDNSLRQEALLRHFGGPSPNHANNHSPYGSSSSSAFAESIFRSYYEQQRNHQHQQRRTPFYFNGIDISNLFPAWGKSIYITKVPVPLADLYKGKARHTFTVKESIWNRYCAAFRGGVARRIALQGLLSSLALLFKSGWTLSVCFFGIYFHSQLPKLHQTAFSTSLKRGWKSGTKLKYPNIEPGMDVIFILKEMKDDRFERMGNDLITVMTISRDEFLVNKRRTGGNRCRFHVPMFDASEGKIEVLLSQSQVRCLETSKTTKITVKGRGWPLRGGDEFGDLIVKIHLKEKRKNKRSRARSSKIKK